MQGRVLGASLCVLQWLILILLIEHQISNHVKFNSWMAAAPQVRTPTPTHCRGSFIAIQQILSEDKYLDTNNIFRGGGRENTFFILFISKHNQNNEYRIQTSKFFPSFYIDPEWSMIEINGNDNITSVAFIVWVEWVWISNQAVYVCRWSSIVSFLCRVFGDCGNKSQIVAHILHKTHRGGADTVDTKYFYRVDTKYFYPG